MSEVENLANQAEAAAAAAVTVKRTRAPAANFLSIVSGRLPLVFVHAVRFKLNGESNSELAKTFSTSVGKIFDIKKGRNFGYIGEGWKPSEADIQTAKNWITAVDTPNKHGLKPEGNVERMRTVLGEYEGNLATADQVALQEALRTSSRTRKPKEAVAAPAAPATDAEQLDGEASMGDVESLLG